MSSPEDLMIPVEPAAVENLLADHRFVTSTKLVLASALAEAGYSPAEIGQVGVGLLRDSIQEQ